MSYTTQDREIRETIERDCRCGRCNMKKLHATHRTDDLRFWNTTCRLCGYEDKVRISD